MNVNRWLIDLRGPFFVKVFIHLWNALIIGIWLEEGWPGFKSQLSRVWDFITGADELADLRWLMDKAICADGYVDVHFPVLEVSNSLIGMTLVALEIQGYSVSIGLYEDLEQLLPQLLDPERHQEIIWQRHVRDIWMACIAARDYYDPITFDSISGEEVIDWNVVAFFNRHPQVLNRAYGGDPPYVGARARILQRKAEAANPQKVGVMCPIFADIEGCTHALVVNDGKVWRAYVVEFLLIAGCDLPIHWLPEGGFAFPFYEGKTKEEAISNLRDAMGELFYIQQIRVYSEYEVYAPTNGSVE